MTIRSFFSPTGTMLERQTIHLIDKLQNAKKNAPHANYINIQRVPIYRDSRSSIFQHPPSRIEFEPVLLGKNPKFRFACGIKQKVWPKLTHGICFEIFIKTTFWKPTRVFKLEVLPSDLREGGWLEQDLDLGNYSNKRIQLIFSTSVLKEQGTEYCWSVWGNPQIVHEMHSAKKHKVSTRPAHIILITADALRADHIGVYCSSEVYTPNCDQLAEDGVLFSHARAQTASTLGSYASMLLSQHPNVHSVKAEWGAIAKGLPSLPGHLHENGYGTIMVPSELELMDSRTGIPSLFDKCVPCLGEPAQDGSLTTRLFLDILERMDKSTFFWLQYFDTHPPVTPPEPYHSMYYSGNPESDANLYRPEAVAMIKGTEAMQDLTVSLPSLKQGFIDGIFLNKLESIVSTFRGQNTSEPDLAIHLKNLGLRAQNNMSHEQFADWLEKQVVQLKVGTVPEPLIQWLDTILPMLQEINDDITAWLNGVVDFRYPVSQYKAGVSYFDSHVGQLLAFMKENELYDRSLIILSSPHGEILDEHDIYFHHHTITESCLRIPMIIKPPQNGRSYKAGMKIDGIFDSLDLFPTITDLLELKPPQGIAGFSRASQVYNGSSIPEHDSFAVNNALSLTSITNGNYKYMRAEKDHLNSKQWCWYKGDQVLFDLRDTPLDTKNRMNEFPELVGEMKQRLELFIKNTTQ